MTIVDVIDRLSQETETSVTGLWDAKRAGRIDENTFVRRSATRVNGANARATATADQAVAADLRSQTGQPVRPAGIKPINDQGRLETAIRKVISDKPKDADTPDAVHESRRSRLGRLARNEPSTAAQNTTQAAMEHHQTFLQGWVRMLGGSKACPLCTRWADSVVRSTKVHMNRHHSCRCIQRPVAKKVDKVVQKDERPIRVFGVPITAKGAVTAVFATPGDEVLISLMTARIGRRALVRPFFLHAGADVDIFSRLAVAERLLGGIELQKGQYMIHGSGLLDALGMRPAADLDLIVHPDLYDEIAKAPGWKKLKAGVDKDYEILSHPQMDLQIGKAYDVNTLGAQRVSVRDLAENTVTINGKEFITPEQLTKMKRVALDAGAKVPKNQRDLALLDGRFTWQEDAARFGRQLNNSAQKATLGERRAIQLYGRGSFELNPKLRTGELLTKAEESQVGLIDRTLARQATPTRVKVYRGLRMTREEALEMYGDKIDTVVREKSYLSTGLREDVARRYGQSGVYLELDVPPGTPGFFAPYRALAPEPTPNRLMQLFGEDELLLPRNTPYRIKEIIEREDGTVLIRGEVIPTRLRPPAPGAGRIVGMAGDAPAPRISVSTPVKVVNKVKVRLLEPGEGPVMHPDLIPDKNVAGTIRRQAQVPGFEDLARRTDRGAFDEIMHRQVRHILHWAERSWQVSPEATRLHANWYPFAHRWLNGLAELNPGNGITREGSYAVTAALSPRADWANNVAWAKRVIEAVSDDVRVDRRWIESRYQLERAAGRAAGRGGGAPRLRLDLVGKRLSEIEDDADVAYILRAWHDDEPLHQLGGAAGFGDPKNIASPNDMGNLAKAVSVARNGSIENIDRTLGGMKVRSFYGNLANPLDTLDLNVTIDTHHYGVANGFPWVANDRFMSSGALNITETPWSAETGVGGTYSLVVEATRRATAIFNELHGTDFLPNQLQSIVWEQHRGDYPPSHRKLELLQRMERIRTARVKGRITDLEEDRLIEAARLRGGAPTLREILAWYEDDLAGRPRRSLTVMRKRKR